MRLTTKDIVSIIVTMVMVMTSVVYSYFVGVNVGQRANGTHDDVPHRSFHQAVQYDIAGEVNPVGDVYKMHPTVFPGAEAYSGGLLCTVGAVGEDFIITAGHCANGAIEVNGHLFDVVDVQFESLGEADWAVAVPTDDAHMANVVDVDGEFMSIGDIVEPEVDMEVCTPGVTTGWVCGTITKVEGDVFHTTMCVRKGDSGSVIITPDGAMVGIVSGAYINGGHQKCVDGYNNHRGDSSSFATSLSSIDSPGVSW